MSVTHLTPTDLDRMAIEVHREADPDFDLRSFAAYAPDPDRDFQRGYDEGYAARDAEDTRARGRLLDVFIICLGLILATAVLLVGGQE